MAPKDPKYGLEFSAGTVSLVRILAPGSFEVVDKADVEERDFSSKMKSLHRVISEDADRMITLPVFLRKVDTPVLTVRVEDDDDPSAVIKAEVEKASETQIDDLSVVEGDAHGPDQKIVYAKRSLMREAKEFLAGFNFEPSYFAPRIRLADFPEDLRFDLGEPKELFRPELAWGGLAAAVVLGIGYGMSVYLGAGDQGVEEKVATAIESTPSTTASAETIEDASDDPIRRISASADLEFYETNASLPWAGAELAMNFADQTARDSVPISLGAVTAPNPTAKQDLFELTGIRGTPRRPAFNPQPVEEGTTETAAEAAEDAIIAATGETDADTADTDNITEAVTRAETDAELQQALLEDINTDQPTDNAAVAERGNTLGDRPLLRPTTLVAFAEPEQPTETQTGDAIADDLLEQAIESDAERNDNLENASRYAAVVTARPPRKTNRWATNYALVLESKRVAAATIATGTASNVEAAAKPEADAAVSEEKDARRVSNTFRRNQLSLIGVVGAPSSRRAIFRTQSGSIRTLKHGQKISGWKLVAIGESSVKVTRQGKEKTMRLP